MSDWIGNTKSTYITLGASNHTDKERQTHDFYATNPSAIDLLETKCDVPLNVWECSCGQGHLSKRLIERGHNVLSTDLVNRGYGSGDIDFLSSRWPLEMPKSDCCILTNPPYKYATEFVLHALDILPDNAPAFFFLKTLFLEGKQRYADIFSQGYLHTVYQCSARVLCAKNGEFEQMRKAGGSAVSYAWFEFRKSPCHATKIVWLDDVKEDKANKSGTTIEHLNKQLNLFDI